MATEQDYRLKPVDNEMSKVICTHCETPIGEVYTAHQTMTGRETGRTETKITTDALEIIGGHLPKCVNRDQAAVRAAYENESPNRPPHQAPVDQRRR